MASDVSTAPYPVHDHERCAVVAVVLVAQTGGNATDVVGFDVELVAGWVA